MKFHTCSSIFIGFRRFFNGPSLHARSMMWADFLWSSTNLRRCSLISYGSSLHARKCSIDFHWRSLFVDELSLVCYWFYNWFSRVSYICSWMLKDLVCISIDFPNIFINVHRLPIDFHKCHWFSPSVHWPSTYSQWCLEMFCDFYRCSLMFDWFHQLLHGYSINVHGCSFIFDVHYIFTICLWMWVDFP